MNEDAKSILARYSGLKSARAPWDGEWNTAATYCMPRKGNIGSTPTPGPQPVQKLYDTTAVESCSILGSGHASAITPAGVRWFSWESPEDIKSDEADAWYSRASETALKVLGASNFYTTQNECFEDRSAFGICCISAMQSAKSGVFFQAHPVGSFVCEEDAEGNVDTVFRETTLTIRNLVELFGEATVMAHEHLAKAWALFKEKGTPSQHCVVHAVFPRLKSKPGALNAKLKPWASIWVAVSEEYLLMQSGFDELPYSVSRYLKRTGSGQVYGYSPFEQCKAAIIEVNEIRQVLKVQGQRIAVPSLLLPDNLVGNVDTRPGGKTVFKSSGASAGALPREWLNAGDPRWMMEQLQDAREAIKQAYHTDLFKMFSQMEKQMTAREVSELSAEKLMPFSPSFSRYTSDNKVFMDALFAILFRMGRFGSTQDIPDAVKRRIGRNAYEVPSPSTVYMSRVALAIRQAESASADRTVERMMTLARLDPGTADNIDLDAYLRLTARNDGTPEDMLRPAEDVKKLREARAQAQQQQAEAEQAEQASKAAKNVGLQIPPGQVPSLG